MTMSIIIAAHNEAAVIGGCLDALAEQLPDSEVIVSANGCRDRTADVAATRGVTVIDRASPGKAAAINAAEEQAQGFPRAYLDADILVPPGGLARMAAALASAPYPLAAVPRRRVDTAGCSWPVRSYFAINERLPLFRTGLFGRGLIMVSERGRARFDTFPLLIADDLFIDSVFSEDEKLEVSDVEVTVEAPRRARDLLARLVRVRRGNAQMRAAAEDGRLPIEVRPSDTWAWLRDVVVPHPRLILAAVPYVLITLLAATRAKRPGSVSWGQDQSTRVMAAEEGPQW